MACSDFPRSAGRPRIDQLSAVVLRVVDERRYPVGPDRAFRIRPQGPQQGVPGPVAVQPCTQFLPLQDHRHPIVDRPHERVRRCREDHVGRPAPACLPDPREGERLGGFEYDPVRLLAKSGGLPFIEAVCDHRAPSMAEGMTESRRPAGGLGPRVDQHPALPTRRACGDPPECAADLPRLRVQDDRQALAWARVVDRQVSLREIGSEVQTECFVVLGYGVAAAHGARMAAGAGGGGGCRSGGPQPVDLLPDGAARLQDPC